MIPSDRTLNTVTPEEWRTSTDAERREFVMREASRGHVSFVCLRCGYPTSYGVASCEACR